MKHFTIKIFSAFTLLVSFSVQSWAQEHLIQAFAKFSDAIVDDNSLITMNKTVNYRDKASGQISGSCSVAEFVLDSHEFQFIQNIIDAMDKDASQAYHSASATAGNEGVTYAIAYGDNENDYELIGADNTMNFKIYCNKDPASQDFRTSYAVEWKPTGDGYYVGKIYRIYGRRPDTSKPAKKKKTTRIYGFNSDDLDDLNFPFNESDMGSFPFKDFEMNGFTLKVDSLIDLNQFSRLKSLKLWKDTTFNGNNNISFSLNTGNDKSDGAQWLSDFGMLYDKYKEKVKISPRKGMVYATELLKLCKNVDDAHLGDGEKKLCVKCLKELQKLVDDTFITGIFDEAIKLLK